MEEALNSTAFRPTDSWRWFFDAKYDCLMLDVNHNTLFRSRYPKKMLIPDVIGTFPFTINDAALYYQFFNSALSLDLTDLQRIELTINAIVAANFLKPQLPKSWYFMRNEKPLLPKLADLVIAHMQSGEMINLLVIESGTHASLCLVAEPTFIAMNRTFYLAEAIKLMNDRLIAHGALADSVEMVNLTAIS
ncbi:cell division protein ZapC [Orbaceae bacterium ESL0721]|nr:cell division protein ZapC [Orbaceae bacterium ESL0721]